MKFEVTFDKDSTTWRYPRKAFLEQGGEECIENLKKKITGVTVKMNKRYVYVTLPFNLITRRGKQDADFNQY